MQCQKKKRDGSQCRARNMTGKKYCSLHSEPAKAAKGRQDCRRLADARPFRKGTQAAPARAVQIGG